jgi:branched-chain amino acid aminotransferase
MHINVNGKIINGEDAKISHDDRSFRYGDGLFETMKILDGKILLESFHFDRLMHGLNIMKFEIAELFLTDKFRSEIIQLCEKNNCFSIARVRLTLSRGNGGLYLFQNQFNYIIEARSLNVQEQSGDGITIGIFRDAKKSCDVFSNLKSANFLPYVMAAIFMIGFAIQLCQMYFG